MAQSKLNGQDACRLFSPVMSENPLGCDTRKTILLAAFNEIHKKGFQAASINQILKHTGVTKGALYHYFPSKLALGFAVVDEVIRVQVERYWIAPLSVAENPIDALISIIESGKEIMSASDIQLGCPVNNLAQEMSAIDEGFRRRLEKIINCWQQSISSALTRGQHRGLVRTDVDVEAMSVFLVASLEGSIGMAKSARSKQVINDCSASIVHLLNLLRTIPK